MTTSFCITLDITLRPARADDLPRLEWGDLQRDQRPAIAAAYAQQERGDALFLLAECGGEPVGQAWVDFVRQAAAGVGLVRALRVHPVFGGLGIGARLLAAAEESIRARGLHTAELSVAQDNPRTRQVYTRLGYRVVADQGRSCEDTTPEGVSPRMAVGEWIMQKAL